MINRRLFLFGTVASIATAKTAWANTIIDSVIPMPTQLGMGPRWIHDIIFSSMTVPEEEIIQDPIRYTFKVDDKHLLAICMNRMATFRWVAVPTAEIFVPGGSTLAMLVNPCASLTTLTVISNVGTLKDPIFYSETSKWQDNEIIESHVEPMDPRKTISFQHINRDHKNDKLP